MAGFGIVFGDVSIGSRIVAALTPTTSYRRDLNVNLLKTSAIQLQTVADWVDEYLKSFDRIRDRAQRLSEVKASASQILEGTAKALSVSQSELQFSQVSIITANAKLDALIDEGHALYQGAPEYPSRLGPLISMLQNSRLTAGAITDLVIANILVDESANSSAQAMARALIPALESVRDITSSLQDQMRQLSPSDSAAWQPILSQIFIQANLLANLSSTLAQLKRSAGPIAPLPQPVVLWCLLDYDLFAGGPLRPRAQGKVAWAFKEGAGLSTVASFATSTVVGYATIHSATGNAPSALGIISSTTDGTLVSVTAVTAAKLRRSGRFPAVINGQINTGLAFANPNSFSVTVAFTIADGGGGILKTPTMSVPANHHLSWMLDETPFLMQPPFTGTVAFVASAPIGAVAIRCRTNERSELLMPTIPIQSKDSPSNALTLPQFAAGEGWTTEIALTNPTSLSLRGILDFSTGVQSRYSIAPGGVEVIQVQSPSRRLETGYVQVVPALFSSAPFAAASILFRNDGVAVSEHSFPAEREGNDFKLYAEVGNTGVTIINASDKAVPIQYEVRTLAGIQTGFSGTTIISAHKHIASFVIELPGLELIPPEVAGVLKVSAAVPVIVAGFRGQRNARGDIIMSFLPAEVPTGSDTILPHFVFGNNYSTQLVLFATDDIRLYVRRDAIFWRVRPAACCRSEVTPWRCCRRIGKYSGEAGSDVKYAFIPWRAGCRDI